MIPSQGESSVMTELEIEARERQCSHARHSGGASVRNVLQPLLTSQCLMLIVCPIAVTLLADNVPLIKDPPWAVSKLYSLARSRPGS